MKDTESKTRISGNIVFYYHNDKYNIAVSPRSSLALQYTHTICYKITETRGTCFYTLQMNAMNKYEQYREYELNLARLSLYPYHPIYTHRWSVFTSLGS